MFLNKIGYLEITSIKTMFSRYLQTIACFIRPSILYLNSEIKVIFLTEILMTSEGR